ncbi:hypothetical protein L0F51_03945 [Afifella sp. H1R]|uniref:hypothetical protein n=1 Tax=Afifella sp. H1R TaxID=2908841 RepID=UPI001F3816D9|nr:hypothetical protein [Afifella sp. H1R]MCF1502918.1 hypothetical protein [Afifella sp. H1R]
MAIPTLADDPCGRAAALREVRTAIATGDSVARARFGEDEMGYFKADAAMLDREIDAADRACAIKEGRAPKRRRYAMRGVMRPY